MHDPRSPLGNPEHEALARHLASATFRNDPAALSIGYYRWHALDQSFDDYTIFRGRLKHLITDRVLTDNALQHQRRLYVHPQQPSLRR